MIPKDWPYPTYQEVTENGHVVEFRREPDGHFRFFECVGTLLPVDQYGWDYGDCPCVYHTTLRASQKATP